uniref:Egg protein CP1183 n=1 Tax=Schistosoma japonicum TaxID=6182 RepID=C1LFN8_SCHJA|nr:Egg protein CP1183 [Schistosoma japonicum]
MQMLNFVKISTMLLLLQLISTNTQHNNPYTVVRINVKSIRLNNNLANIDGNSRPVYQYDNAGEIKEQIPYCEVFTQWPMDLLPPNPQGTGCTDNNFEPAEKYYHEYGLRVYSELKYIYPEIVEVDINNFIKEMRKRIENKADNLQMVRNLIEVEYMNISVETITPDVPSSKPTSTPVTNGKTVLTIFVKTVSFRAKDEKGDVHRGEFLAKSLSGRFYLTEEFCDIFMLFAQKYVPVNWGELRCNNVSSKILGTRSNDLILQKVSQLQFIYMNEENLDKAKLAATLYQNYREGYLNHERSLNDIDDVEFEVLVQHTI